MLYLSDTEVTGIGREVGREALIETVEGALCELAEGGVTQPTKTALHPSEGVFFHALPVYAESLGAALKWVSYAPGNTARGLPRSSVRMILSDASTGLPSCLLDGLWLTAARTGACAAVAARRLARPGARTLTLVGGGPVNRSCLPYLVASLPDLAEVRVVAADEASARRHVVALEPTLPGLALRACAGPEEGVVGADVVISAIGEQARPVLRGEWLGEGALALPLEGEAAWDSQAFGAVDRLIADDADVFVEAFRRNRPGESPPAVDAELAAVVAGQAVGRAGDGERIIDSNNGIGVLDLALGRLVFDRARELGVGMTL